MKHLKYALFLCTALVLAVQSYAQPDTRRMNISIGIFSPSATAYDYEGAIGVVGSTGYTVDDIQPGDMFWDDASRYRVDSVEVIVAGSSATVWVTDLYGGGAPQSGKGTLGQPSPRTGIQPLTENGSNFITEAQEAKILTDNLQRLDSLGGDGNGIIGALPLGDVSIDAAGNKLVLSNLDSFVLDTSFVVQPQQFGSRVLMDINEDEFRLRGNPTGVAGEFGLRMFTTPSFRQIFIGDFGNDHNQALLGVNDHTTTAFLHGGYSCGINAGPSVTTIGDYLKDGDETYIELDVNGDMTFSTFNDIFFRGDGWAYQWPSGAPTANQVLGEGAVDDDVLEWVNLPAADGNGIISTLPTAPVNIDANGNALIIDSTSTTKITAVGVAKGDLVVSGLSSLPSSLSHIEGIDTAQVNVRAGGGISLTSTQSVGITAPVIDIGRSLEVTQLGFNDHFTHKGTGAGFFRILDYGNLDPILNDPIGIEMFHSSTARRITIGDSESEYNQTKLYIDDYNSRADLGGYDFGFKYLGNTISLGDHNYDNNGTRLYIDDPNLNVKLGSFGDEPMFIEVDNQRTGDGLYTIKMGDVDGSWSGAQVLIVDDDGNEADGYVSVGDTDDAWNGTILKVDIYPAEITLRADNGVIVEGTSHSYTLPVTTPTSADSLDRAMVWRQGASSFKAVNDGDFRTASVSGNILPYDDIIECVPDVTVHLPAPSTTFQGKIYHIYVGGAGAGGGVTIDVADGSSTIQTNPSISMSSAWEAYTLTCNGSQWVVLNHKP